MLNVLLTGELVLPPPPSFKTDHFAPGVNSGEQEPPPIPTEVIRELGLDELAENYSVWKVALLYVLSGITFNCPPCRSQTKQGKCCPNIGYR